MTDESLALRPGDVSFEGLKKINEHGAEYWSARDLQALLGYAHWRSFENAITKAITSCEKSGNAVDHHFARAQSDRGGQGGAARALRLPSTLRRSRRG